MGVTLACAWRPRGELGRWLRLRSRLDELYERVIVAVPFDADAAQTAEAARAIGYPLRVAPARFRTRYTVLEMAFEAAGGSVHYADGDRLLHWAETAPDELARVVPAIGEADVLIIGRSPAALATHPRALQDTEAIVNALASHLLGMAVDLGGGSRGLSATGLAAVLRHATPERFGDAEWPILARRLGLRVDYRAADGLAWETPDHDRAAAAEVARRAAASAAYDADVGHWVGRVRTAREIVREALDAATRPLPTAS
ncbi:MAG TPA: hypothetical protein VGJ70_01070 [Solirubrobacteraceae bacterium]